MNIQFGSQFPSVETSLKNSAKTISEIPQTGNYEGPYAPRTFEQGVIQALRAQQRVQQDMFTSLNAIAEKQ